MFRALLLLSIASLMMMQAYGQSPFIGSFCGFTERCGYCEKCQGLICVRDNSKPGCSNNKCAYVRCSPCEDCVDGRCVPDWDNDECKQGRCGNNRNCGNCQHCERGQCVDSNTRNRPGCSRSGGNNNNNNNRAGDQCGNRRCNANQCERCDRNRAGRRDDECVSSCSASEECRNGSCQRRGSARDPCSTVRCGWGKRCVNGLCV